MAISQSDSRYTLMKKYNISDEWINYLPSSQPYGDLMKPKNFCSLYPTFKLNNMLTQGRKNKPLIWNDK
eukprot:Pgem_evm1s17703